MPIPFSIVTEERPDRFTSDKDAAYHIKFARYTGGTITNALLTEYYWRIWLNWQFYKGLQWIYSDDTTVFFQDADGQARGRIRAVINIIRPFVLKMIDEANKMSLDFKAKSVGDRVINRREQELARLKGARAIADLFPNLEKTIKKKRPVGNTMDETEEIFRNVWVDEFEQTVNNMVKYVKEKNRLDTVIRNFIEKELAVTGMAVVNQIARGNELILRPISTENFFWDAGALFPDFSDAEFMGDTEFAMPTDLYEMYDLSKKEKERIEKSTQYLPTTAPIYMPMPYAYAYQPGRICKINTQWRDAEKQDYGFVIDQYGQEFLTRVYPNSTKAKPNERLYHFSDLIEPQSDRNREFMKGEKKKKIDIEVIRFCEFTPMEAIGSGKSEDIVYNYGIVPYQETNCTDPTISEFTYKVQCWDYHDGFVSTPLDDIIDPQRLVNRATSIAEARMNTVGGSGTFIDIKAASGGDMTLEEIERRQQRGETVLLDGTRLGGLQNAVVPYGTNVGNNVMGFIEYADAMQNKAQQITGIYSSPNPRTPKKIALGQEEETQSLHGNYLNCIESLYQQITQGIANRGRKIYADSPRRLSIMVGDKGMQEIVITKGMQLEDFRMFVNRSDDEKLSKLQAQSALTQLYASAIITKQEFADNYGRVTVDDIGKVIRDSIIRENTAKKAAEEQQKQEAAVATMQHNANQERIDNQDQIDRSREDAENDKNREAKTEQIIVRTQGQIERDKHKADLKKQELILKKQLEENHKEQLQEK